MLLVLFRHNKTPKVLCLTFGVHVRIGTAIVAVIAALGFSYLYTRGVSPVWAAVAMVCFPGFFSFIYKIACIVMAALILFAILSFLVF